MGDFVSMPMSEIERFSKMEQLLKVNYPDAFTFAHWGKMILGISLPTFTVKQGFLLMTTTTIYPNDMKIKSVGKEIRYY